MKIIVAAVLHRRYWTPQDPLYLPMQVGVGDEDLRLARDNTGDHISDKNPSYSELTAQYWLWKNSAARQEADAYGLCHYRRYFTRRKGLIGRSRQQILTLGQARELLREADVIVPRPRIYLIETNYTQYIHSHHAADLDTTREVIAQLQPEFLPAWDRVMKRRWGRRFNMCIMRREKFCAYSQWLFSILFELEKRLDVTGYNEKDSRVFGYVAERLMDVWLEQTQPRIRQVPVVNLEGENWPGKIATFLRRRVLSDEQLRRRQAARAEKRNQPQR